jgi:hypothetical protein
VRVAERVALQDLRLVLESTIVPGFHFGRFNAMNRSAIEVARF